MNNIFENDKVRLAYQKMYNESVEGVSHKLIDNDNPAVYIGTYGNYNNASLDGEGEASGWIDLTTFDSSEDFHEWLNQQANGKDVEWMFQDYMNFPSEIYNESDIDDFWVYQDIIDTFKYDKQVIDALLTMYSLDEVEHKLRNGDVRVWDGCNEVEDVVDSMIAENGENYFRESQYRRAFDYEGYGRDFAIEWSPSRFDIKNEDMTVYEWAGVSEKDDESLGEVLVDTIDGGVEKLPNSTIMKYINKHVLARMLEEGSTFIRYDDGMIEVYR